MTSRLQQAKAAVRVGRKARIALSGPAGAGKTWTALDLAHVLAPEGKVLVIDTERGSASLYSDAFAFDELDWTPPYDPRQLAETLKDAAINYDVVVVDSLTHFWQGEGGTLDIVENSATRTAGGNRFAGWKTGTPAQNFMVESLLTCAAHVIVTMRSKTEYVIDQSRDGKAVPRKVGLAPIQRDGIEYEFTVTADLDFEHRLSISKTRCHLLADKMYQGGRAREMGETLRDWLAGAEEAPSRAQVAESSDAHLSDPAPTTDSPLVALVATTLYAHPEKGRLFGKHRASVGRGDLAGVSRWVNGLDVGDLTALAVELGVSVTDTQPAPESEAPSSVPSQNGAPAPSSTEHQGALL